MKHHTNHVASGHPLVSQAALHILENGGNAFDAIIAAGFTATLAEPALTSLGGGGFLLARTSDGDEALYDFFSDTPGIGRAATELEPHFFPITVHFPGSDQIFNIGLGSVAVPGNLKGFLHVHSKRGILPLSEVLAPAIAAARSGVILNYHQSYFLDLLEPIMVQSEAGKRIFAPNGTILKQGEKIFNHDLANFLETLPDHGDSQFHKGIIAERIANDMSRGQGLLSYDDLNNFEVIEKKPLQATYKNRTLLTNPPPSFGGSLIAATLTLMNELNLTDLKWGDSDHLCALAHVLVQVDAMRNEYGNSNTPIPPSRYNQSSQAVRTFCRGTTHISILDSQGNAASMTTSNGEGSGYIVPNTGIMLNNMMGEDDLHPEGFHASQPGMRIASMMSPSMLINDGTIEMVIGSGGSKRIRTAIPQVISNVIDFDIPIQKAVEASRIHWDDDILQVEPSFPQTTIEHLNGHFKVNEWSEKNMYFGGVHAVSPTQGGAADLRRGGCALSTK